MLNPSRYRIITIGRIRKRWIQDGLVLYLKRLPGLTITQLRDSNLTQETKAIQTALKSDEAMIALAEEGEALSSVALAERLQNLGSQKLAFVIGGANGLSAEIKRSANLTLSLSLLTFPHEIAHLLLAEQIYRAQTILQGGPYHRYS